MSARTGLVLALLLLAAAPVAAATGTLLLGPGGVGEVEIPTRGAGDRIAYRFNVTPAGEVVEFNIRYLKEREDIVERAPQNLSSERGTFFPLRRTSFFLGFHNWVDTTLTVDWEWHYVGSIPPTRDTPAVGGILLAFGVGAGAALVRKR